MDNRVIVIGAGPAGLVCALYLSKGDASVTLLEKKEVCGKKLLISGSGRCNVTHTGKISSFFNRYGKNGIFLRKSLTKFTNSDLQKLLTDGGIKISSNPDGKIFPEERSVGVRNLFQKLCVDAGVTILNSKKVLSIEKNEGNDPKFTVITDSERLLCNRVVIATGGITYPVTGSNGDGYKFAHDLGHTIIPARPALTPVYIKNFAFGDLSGISFSEVSVSLFRDRKKITEQNGDLLITHFGFSGPVILDMSRYIMKGDELRISFLSGKNHETEKNEVSAALTHNGSVLIKTALSSLHLPERFIKKILEVVKVPPDLTSSHLTKEKRQKIIEKIVESSFIIDNLAGVNEAMVTCGGVSIDEINPNTMESKIVPSLYFAGEVMDIDGDCGGFNIQAAVSTGVLAAKSCLEGLKSSNHIDN